VCCSGSCISHNEALQGQNTFPYSESFDVNIQNIQTYSAPHSQRKYYDDEIAMVFARESRPCGIYGRNLPVPSAPVARYEDSEMRPASLEKSLTEKFYATTLQDSLIGTVIMETANSDAEKGKRRLALMRR
jgi:hypothetical protein